MNALEAAAVDRAAGKLGNSVSAMILSGLTPDLAAAALVRALVETLRRYGRSYPEIGNVLARAAQELCGRRF